MHPGTTNPDAALAVVDVAKGDTTVITNSRFRVGEPYGYVAWSPDGTTVFFTGNHGVQSYNVDTHHLTEAHLPRQLLLRRCPPKRGSSPPMLEHRSPLAARPAHQRRKH